MEELIQNDLNTEKVEDVVEETPYEKVTINLTTVLRTVLLVAGVASIIVAFSLYAKDLDTVDGPFNFDEERYVGGDAYNYIISAARSSAVMVKSLIWMVFGCTMTLLSCIFHKKQ